MPRLPPSPLWTISYLTVGILSNNLVVKNEFLASSFAKFPHILLRLLSKCWLQSIILSDFKGFEEAICRENWYWRSFCFLDFNESDQGLKQLVLNYLTIVTVLSPVNINLITNISKVQHSCHKFSLKYQSRNLSTSRPMVWKTMSAAQISSCHKKTLEYIHNKSYKNDYSFWFIYLSIQVEF